MALRGAPTQHQGRAAGDRSGSPAPSFSYPSRDGGLRICARADSRRRITQPRLIPAPCRPAAGGPPITSDLTPRRGRQALQTTTGPSSAARCEILGDRTLRDPDRVRDTVVLELATAAERIDRRGRDLEPLGHVVNRQLPHLGVATDRMPIRVSKGVSKESVLACGLIRCVHVGRSARRRNFGPLRLAAARRGLAAPPSGAEGHGFESRSRRPPCPRCTRASPSGAHPWTRVPSREADERPAGTEPSPCAWRPAGVGAGIWTQSQEVGGDVATTVEARWVTSPIRTRLLRLQVRRAWYTMPSKDSGPERDTLTRCRGPFARRQPAPRGQMLNG